MEFSRPLAVACIVLLSTTSQVTADSVADSSIAPNFFDALSPTALQMLEDLTNLDQSELEVAAKETSELIRASRTFDIIEFGGMATQALIDAGATIPHAVISPDSPDPCAAGMQTSLEESLDENGACLEILAITVILAAAATDQQSATGWEEDAPWTSWLFGTALPRFPGELCSRDGTAQCKIYDDYERLPEAIAILEARLDIAEYANPADPDNDGLDAVDEVRWNYERCICPDFDGDSWRDGDEVAYWNNPNTDRHAVVYTGYYLFEPGNVSTDGSEAGYLVSDPEASLDTDDDGQPNSADTDSDNDGIKDGLEEITLPEFFDSDCSPFATYCQTLGNYWSDREGNPGTGDGLPDLLETTVFGRYYSDIDHDRISSQIDPDSDGDGFLDGQEYFDGRIDLKLPDTDFDGLKDGLEKNWSNDFDGAGLISAQDPDSDNDAMTDGWEVSNGLDPENPNDGPFDYDDDGLNNAQEFQLGTYANRLDSDNDFLADNDEVILNYNPLNGDSNGDGLPDWFEKTYSIPPAPTAYNQDLDSDSFDQGSDGTIEQPWTNLHEYRYGRPTGYNEATLGPWVGGTNPRLADTDGDGALDGNEAFYGTDAIFAGNSSLDLDQDGLTWAFESRLGTSPILADTDGDGLCDGGLAANCTLGSNSNSFQPGELQFGTVQWDSDSDNDGVQDLAEAVAWTPIGFTSSAYATDLDADGLPGPIDADSDDDGLNDGAEWTNAASFRDNPDSDGDSLVDGREVRLGTLPLDSDSDDDQLDDGAEINQYRTSAINVDSDGDLLNDYAEAILHHTNALLEDSEKDGMPDGWEIQFGTNPLTFDQLTDDDGDGLPNVLEFKLLLNPLSNDTDLDGMLDGYEVKFGLNPRSLADALFDKDFDGLLNLDELRHQTNPSVPDTDGDQFTDGNELQSETDPLDPDSDDDQMTDGAEKAAWDALSSSAWGTDYDQGGEANNLRDADSDNDALNDYDEFHQTKTRPDRQDTDSDGLLDRQETLPTSSTDANNEDTDQDNVDDSKDLQPSADDDDGDGLKNNDEATYGTDSSRPDSDCDGIHDRAELNYWGDSWNSGGNRLQNPDVDGDGLSDGSELGTVGSAGSTVYRTSPANPDTDGDGLDDGHEDRNAEVSGCDYGAPYASNIVLPTTLLKTVGWAIPPDKNEVDAQAASSEQPRTTSNPTLPDTDGDGLEDGQEAIYHHTDPLDCDSDGDGLGDGLELGVTLAMQGTRSETSALCKQRDVDPSSTSNPLNSDTDADGLTDALEDANDDGASWVQMDVNGYCGLSGETAPNDDDSDDDGVSDLAETATHSTRPLCFDTDQDGLSDGLELGKTTNDLPGTSLSAHAVLQGRIFPRFQQSTTGALLNTHDPDLDNDGIIDGLEDLDHDGHFGSSDWNSELGTTELDPTNFDTDNDQLGDGRELLLWAMDSYGSPIQVAMQRWGGSIGPAKFDSGNPWQTDPRDDNSDDDATADGNDLNPRADAFIGLAFPGFRMLTQPDSDGSFSEKWEIEMYFPRIAIDLPLLNGDYEILMTEEDAVDVPAQYESPLNDAVLEKLRVEGDAAGARASSSISNLGWKAQKISEKHLLQLNIPDDFGTLDPSMDLRISVEISMSDQDQIWNDVVDLHDGDGTVGMYQFTLAQDLPGELDPSLPEYLVASGTTEVLHGNGHSGHQRVEDGSLAIQGADNVPMHFLKGINKIPLEGPCFGEASCV